MKSDIIIRATPTTPRARKDLVQVLHMFQISTYSDVIYTRIYGHYLIVEKKKIYILLCVYVCVFFFCLAHHGAGFSAVRRYLRVVNTLIPMACNRLSWY